jgi:hypothetical protein
LAGLVLFSIALKVGAALVKSVFETSLFQWEEILFCLKNLELFGSLQLRKLLLS